MTRSQSPLMICARASSVTTQHEVWFGGEGGWKDEDTLPFFLLSVTLACVTSRFRFPPKFRLMSCKGLFKSSLYWQLSISKH